MRRGIHRYPPEVYEGCKSSIGFVGQHISNSLIAFYCIMIIFGVFFSPFCWDMFWIYLYNHLLGILLVILLPLPILILNMFFEQFCVQDHNINHPK